MSEQVGIWKLDGLHEALMKERDFLYKEMKNLEQENARLREALVEASEYARCDDVNGEAGSICLKALEKSE